MQYQIEATRYFYGPTEIKSIVESPWSTPLVLPSSRAALAWIKSADKDVYHLAHNESSRPTFSLVPIK